MTRRKCDLSRNQNSVLLTGKGCEGEIATGRRLVNREEHENSSTRENESRMNCEESGGEGDGRISSRMNHEKFDKYQNSFMKEKASLKFGDVVKEPREGTGGKNLRNLTKEKGRGKGEKAKGEKNRRSRRYLMKEKWSP